MGFLEPSDPLFEPTPYIVGGVAIGVSAVALLVALLLSIVIFIGKTGNKEMNEVAIAIRKGAMAFMTVEYLCLSVFAIIMFIIISVAVSWQSGICYLVGSVLAGAAGFIGMFVATQANVRTTEAAKKSLSRAMRMAFNGGSVMGLIVAGVGLGGLSAFYLIFGEDSFNEKGFCAAFGLGVTSVSLFARVGGGIFTKAADVGADIVGKVETGLPEDDARNPATIADNVGDNVGDVAGMGADLCGSFVGSIICSCILGFESYGLSGAAFPIWIGSAGIICSIIGQVLVRCRPKAKQLEVLIAFRIGQYVASALLIGFSALITYLLSMPWFYLVVIVLGLACGMVIATSTEFFTSPSYQPTKSISHAAGSAGGAASVVIQGLSVGMYATVIPAVAVAATLIICVVFGGMYGAALASTGLLGCLSFTLATDGFGAIADNAGGIAEMCELDEEVRERTDVLDSLGNTTAAVGKGYAIGSALLTGISLCSIFSVRVDLLNLDVIGDPFATAGVLVGAMMPFFFSALTMGAVSNCAQAVFVEVRRQLRQIPGIMDRTQKPDYARLVVIVTGSSIHAMLGPGTIALLIPLCSGIWFKPSFLGGMLVANTACGFMLSTMMATSGGSWDNAKKYVESGHYGGKHSEAHKATVVGDTIGDPFKDTSGPAINILIKLVNYTGVVLAPVYKEQASFWWAAFIIFFGVLAILLPVMAASPSNLTKLKKWINSKRSGNVGDVDTQEQDDTALKQDITRKNEEMDSLPATSPKDDDDALDQMKVDQEKQQPETQAEIEEDDVDKGKQLQVDEADEKSDSDDSSKKDEE